MRCPRCLNENPEYFYKGHKGYYCRKCVSFKRIGILEELEPLDYDVDKTSFDYDLSFKLTKFQDEASLKVSNYIKESDVLLYCVCGAGKTEITLRTISNCLKEGKKVCYAIARKEVVKEMIGRFQLYFKDAKVIGLYGGHIQEDKGDIMIATCHQLYRYYKTFDLLILDEVDAFPLVNNYTLMNICLNACKGKIIFSTATINEFVKEVLKKRNYQIVRLLFRPSGKPLILPKVYSGPILLNVYRLYKILKKNSTQLIVFVSKKKEAVFFYRLFKFLFNCTYVYSDLLERDDNIRKFKNKEYNIIFSTTVLERGINIKDVDVVVWTRKENLFDEANYIQMTGRVGRSINNPYGNAYILSKRKDKEIKKCLSSINEANYELSIL